jgi:hypothetical protein
VVKGKLNFKTSRKFLCWISIIGIFSGSAPF